MAGLVRQAVRPQLGLKTSVEDWYNISCQLREPSRKRQLQIEKLIENSPLLS